MLMGLSDTHTTRCAKGGEDGSSHGGDNLHNPLYSFFLSHSSLKFNVSKISLELARFYQALATKRIFKRGGAQGPYRLIVLGCVAARIWIATASVVASRGVTTAS